MRRPLHGLDSCLMMPAQIACTAAVDTVKGVGLVNSASRCSRALLGSGVLLRMGQFGVNAAAHFAWDLLMQ